MNFYPELLKFNGGEEVKKENWEARRKELVEVLAHEEYGISPQKPEKVEGTILNTELQVASGHAVIERINISFEAEKGEFSFPINFIYPKDKKNSPLFILLNFRPDLYDMYYPLEEIIDNGFALAVIHYNDVTSDDGDFSNGIAAMYERKNPDTDWGKISMWAFSASRVLDYLESRDEIDKDNVAIIGHSRLGKTDFRGRADARILDLRTTLPASPRQSAPDSRRKPLPRRSRFVARQYRALRANLPNFVRALEGNSRVVPRHLPTPLARAPARRFRPLARRRIYLACLQDGRSTVPGRR